MSDSPVGKRIRSAMYDMGPGAHGRGVLGLTNALRQTRWGRGRGKVLSRATVQRYLSGETQPPLDFLSATAEMLGVRAEWLAFGTGPRSADPQEQVHDAALCEKLRRACSALPDGASITVPVEWVRPQQ